MCKTSKSSSVGMWSSQEEELHQKLRRSIKNKCATSLKVTISRRKLKWKHYMQMEGKGALQDLPSSDLLKESRDLKTTGNKVKNSSEGRPQTQKERKSQKPICRVEAGHEINMSSETRFCGLFVRLSFNQLKDCSPGSSSMKPLDMEGNKETRRK